MPTLNEILANQLKLISDAKATLVAAQNKPPTSAAPMAVREASLADLKEHVLNLNKANASAVEKFERQITEHQAQIKVLEQEIAEAKKLFADIPVPTSPAKRKGRAK